MNRYYEKIIDQHHRRIYGYLMKFFLSPEDVEDLLQDVFISFYAKMDNIDPQKYSSYLFRTAHNKAINYLKKQKKFVDYNEFYHQEITHANNEDKEKAKEIKIKIALAKLKPKEMLAIELKFYQNKSYREIADILETTPNAVDSLLFRARKKLRLFLKEK